jgi:hypothetical protein
MECDSRDGVRVALAARCAACLSAPAELPRVKGGGGIDAAFSSTVAP